MSRLNEKAVLVTVNIGTFGNTVKNEAASAELRAKHNTEKKNAAVVYKIFDPDELLPIERIYRKARTEVYKLTIPFDHSGNLVLPIGKKDKLKEIIFELESKGGVLVDEMAQRLPDIKEQRKRELNGLFEERRFPTEDRFKSSFRININYSAIPNRETILDDEYISEETKEDLLNSLKENGKVILSSLLFGDEKDGTPGPAPKTLYGILKKFSEKMREDEPHFKNASVNALKDFCHVIGEFNIFDNDFLNEIKDEVESRFEDLDPETLRDSKEARQDAISEADELLDILEGYEL
jgi:hypothetical protein